MKQPVERRLAAILAADVAGYSRLMGADEEGTHEQLKAHLGELVEPKIGEHRGRIVKNTTFVSTGQAFGLNCSREPTSRSRSNGSKSPNRTAGSESSACLASSTD